MPQTYSAIPSTDTLSASRQKLIDRDDANQSNFSGTAFPTSNLAVGMFCFRTDQNKLYQLKDTTPTWIEVTSIAGSVAIVPNSALLNGFNSSQSATANTVAVRNASGQLAGDITGNAASATALATGRTFALTGDATGTSAAFTGAANASIPVTLANTAVTPGSYTAANITVDSKGRITAASSNSSIVASFNGRTGAVSLTSGDVTGALGYTPLSAGGGSVGTITVNGSVTIQGGRLRVGESNNTSSFIEMMDDESANGLKYIHANSNVIGFLSGTGGWMMYVNTNNHIWTPGYGWLHDFFFYVVANCAGEGSARDININCYGGGNILAGSRSELIDEGGQIRLRGVNWYVNCNCACNC